MEAIEEASRWSIRCFLFLEYITLKNIVDEPYRQLIGDTLKEFDTSYRSLIKKEEKEKHGKAC